MKIVQTVIPVHFHSRWNIAHKLALLLKQKCGDKLMKQLASDLEQFAIQPSLRSFQVDEAVGKTAVHSARTFLNVAQAVMELGSDKLFLVSVGVLMIFKRCHQLVNLVTRLPIKGQ